MSSIRTQVISGGLISFSFMDISILFSEILTNLPFNGTIHFGVQIGNFTENLGRQQLLKTHSQCKLSTLLVSR